MKTGYKRILMVVMVVLLAIVGAAVTFAQDSTVDEAPAAGVQQQGQGGGRHGQFANKLGREVMEQVIDREAMQATLAEALGMSVEELEAAKAAGQRLPEIAEAQGVTVEAVQAAMQGVWETAVNDALAAGTITQEQANMLLERGVPFGRGGRGEMGDLMQTVFSREAMQATLAEALGMSVEELEAAKAAGQRLPEIAEAQGVTVEEVQTAVEAARTAAIEAALAAGTITQEQADQLLSHPWHPGGRGHHGGHHNGFGGPKGKFGGAGFQPTAPASSDGNA